jgi:hypothetical protein
VTAPTEQEIREVVRRRIADWPDDNPINPLRDALYGLTTMLSYTAPEPDEDPEEADGDDLWEDLRPREWRLLNEIREETINRAQTRALAVITEEIVAGALDFAAEYPHAPRAKVPVEA